MSIFTSVGGGLNELKGSLTRTSCWKPRTPLAHLLPTGDLLGLQKEQLAGPALSLTGSTSVLLNTDCQGIIGLEKRSFKSNL